MRRPGDVITILVDEKPVETFIDEIGTQRFRVNTVLRHLVDTEVIDLNKLIKDFYAGQFSLEDYQKFYMALGYSVGGFEELFSSGSGIADATEKPVKILNPMWED